ncbi:4Fe-4S ferredoxin, iron-sulfur binding domain protein [Alkaliphilus metalliredigens QYMF]|uniref:4Fe-4S ferredoxin, iron-sulfur binding domain protein n=1 Tax=Alkaliphilus metalliredigens (strain QYMF) TaxID=293826 RepID=A6TN05_ALKMQ|nr:4Fe-4S binding protein [Alkaliphilus metalliredigens]ABR47573.1 4Fe-4S ferredoxin, iron-sulfur binding domain protein [Alkaliphilus metalliredigens QYMF]
MAIRQILKIDEEKCDGCGLCIPNCAEGAMQIVDGKVKLIDDKYCDGLGACLGHCPQDALELIEREAPEYDEEAVIELLASQGKTFTPQHNETTEKEAHGGPHGHTHEEEKKGHDHGGHGCGCPGNQMMQFDQEEEKAETVESNDVEIQIKSQLKQWPVQLKLVSPNAPYFHQADLLVTADCVPVAFPNYHLDLLKGKAVAVGCPKLDDVNFYVDKLAQMIELNDFKSITVAYMEVPCCQGIVWAVEEAIKKSGRTVPLNKVKIGLQGNKL